MDIAEEKNQSRLDLRTGLLILPISGILYRGAPAESEAFYDTYDSARIDAAAAFAATDPRVRSLLLIWDSPGGYCQGMDSTLASLQALQTSRPDLPITSLVAGQCCSMAYIFANAAGRIEALPGTTIGSIGVMAVTTDSSALYRTAGIERRLITDGIYKGMGTPGIPWTAEWYASVEASVAALSITIRAGILDRRPALTIEDMQGQVWESAQAPAAMLDALSSAPSIEDYIEEYAARI
jgi:ClpP class serine protease